MSFSVIPFAMQIDKFYIILRVSAPWILEGDRNGPNLAEKTQLWDNLPTENLSKRPEFFGLNFHS
jgi:hypothetical protein